jgi:hypothetical protein
MKTTSELAEVIKRIDPDFQIESLEDEMKIELFIVAFKKFTLTELEKKLGGNRFNL